MERFYSTLVSIYFSRYTLRTRLESFRLLRDLKCTVSIVLYWFNFGKSIALKSTMLSKRDPKLGLITKYILNWTMYIITE